LAKTEEKTAIITLYPGFCAPRVQQFLEAIFCAKIGENGRENRDHNIGPGFLCTQGSTIFPPLEEKLFDIKFLSIYRTFFGPPAIEFHFPNVRRSKKRSKKAFFKFSGACDQGDQGSML
jgi:hypothetical protein